MHHNDSTQISDSSRTVSNWMQDVTPLERPPLADNAQTDVCIIGAGISGLSVAYHLAKAGKKVLVLDDGPIGMGESSRTTGHLASVIDDDFGNIRKAHGEDGLKLAYEAHQRAVETIERIAREENIECEFARLNGYLFNKPGESPDFLPQELEAAQEAGFYDAQMLDDLWVGKLSFGAAIRFPRQGRFHVLKYLYGLVEAIERNGGRICTGSHVEGAEADKETGGAKVKVRDGLEVKCEAAVGCVNAPFGAKNLNFKEFPFRTYAIAGPIPKDAIEDALYWDTADPYDYVRMAPRDENTNWLIIGGQDHKTGEADDAKERYDKLEIWARERFPALGEIELQWSGQVWEPVDGLSYTGRIKQGEPLFVHTGDSGMGLTHGTIAGILISDLILGRKNAWEELFDPNRTGLKAPTELLAEQGHIAVQQTKEYLSGGEIASEDELRAGEGAVMRQGLSKIAVYRDEEGQVHKLSAVCTHMKCIVSFNSEEKSWDCPCHGSRFDVTGRCINGPAVEPLPEVE